MVQIETKMENEVETRFVQELMLYTNKLTEGEPYRG